MAKTSPFDERIGVDEYLDSHDVMWSAPRDKTTAKPWRAFVQMRKRSPPRQTQPLRYVA